MERVIKMEDEMEEFFINGEKVKLGDVYRKLICRREEAKEKFSKEAYNVNGYYCGSFDALDEFLYDAFGVDLPID